MYVSFLWYLYGHFTPLSRSDLAREPSFECPGIMYKNNNYGSGTWAVI